MDNWEGFLSVLVISFSVITLLAGIFTAYFGNGRSRTMGVAFVILGIIIAAAWVYIAGPHSTELIRVPLLQVLKDAFVYIAAAIIGFILAAGMFLLAIMKV